MSIKKKTKVEYSTSPRGQFLKQINNHKALNKIKQKPNENNTELMLLQKMEHKIGKILTAYQKLEDQSRNKDQIIKELEKENLLLKERLVEKSQNGNSKVSWQQSELKSQPPEGYIIQRTFTPSDIKFQQKAENVSQQSPTKSFQPTSINVQQLEIKIPSRKVLKESRSVQNLKIINPYMQSYFQELSPNIRLSQPNEQENNFQQKQNQNKLSRIGLAEDNSYMDVLGKLKQRIRTFDELDHEENKICKIEYSSKQQQLRQFQNPSLILFSKAKSSHNLTRKVTTVIKDSRLVQDQARRQISQSDQEIKRMDKLFQKIDERLNGVQNQ